TGVAVRKKLVFKVYGMAHYAQDPVKGPKEEVLAAMLVDGKARQITMDFARDVDAGKIRDAYMDGFKENCTAEEMKAIQPLVDQFVGFFSTEVKENQQFIVRWLPGGIVIATVAGEEKPPITGTLFARVLWSIWLGKDSIVDREDLVARITTN
ncbi:MAG TPA: chalcone isomerase family protein, partial [Bacteroidota bacterium]|nr:chalcone isomerase family protein [Bacteroidota bacterium]